MIGRCFAVAMLGLTIGFLAEPWRAIAQTPAEDEAARAKILEGASWRCAMFEVNEWLMNQRVYTREQVDEMREEFRERVAEMEADELALVLADLETKLHIIDSQEAREARAWMAEYVSVMSDRKRAEVLRDLPNLAQMTSAQLHQEVLRIIKKRANLDQRQLAFRRSQAQQVASQGQRNQFAPQIPARARAATTFSPYRSQSNVNERLNAAPANRRPSFFVDAWGNVGRTLPSSW